MTAPALYPPIEAYAEGTLEVGDGNRLYWQECGNADGKPAVFLHGGPGGGITPNSRRFFDPDRYRVILFDQRGCGASTPHASAPDADLSTNTTWHLVDDIEAIRADRGIDRWLVFGGSWGSALALAYAEKHPDRVSELVVRGVFTLRRRELDWYYNGPAGQVFPEMWERLLAPLGGERFTGDVIEGYHRLLWDRDPAVARRAAVAWATWEAATVTLVRDAEMIDAFSDSAFALAFARIENHYFRNAGWFEEGQLIAEADRLRDIPGAIVHGRYDMACPLATAWDLHRVWTGARLEIVEASGHSAFEPAVAAALVRATDGFAR